MFLHKSHVVAILCSMAVATSFAFQSSPANRPWPPGVQKVSNESPVLSPADAVKTFFMPPGYHVELVASEPLVQDPTVMDWDLSGRLWVVEMTGFVRDLQTPEPNLDPIGHVVVLEDTNHDGVMDKRTVFADGLILPRALKVLDQGVLVGEPGSLWLMRDTNGDLRADTKELVTHDYGRLEGSVEGNANSLYWALDNWIHTSGADVYMRVKDGKVDVHPRFHAASGVRPRTMPGAFIGTPMSRRFTSISFRRRTTCAIPRCCGLEEVTSRSRTTPTS